MSKTIPSVQKYMSTSPVTIGLEQPMSEAHDLMREHRIRHLPVLHGGRIVGILSDGDLHLVETIKDVDPRKIQVSEAMTADPYCVDPATPLDEVVESMAKGKFGCAVVQQNHHVVGIFTTVDACQAFADLLHKRLTH